jgi:antitoxin (DNA-binding transcriptional repressor) of toxin-antitoxin stability system
MCNIMASQRTAALQTADMRVGVRELRQNLSVYLVRIAAGETLEVTDRGRAVAVLAPLPPAATLVQKLVAAGRATPGTGAALPPLRRLTPASHRLGRRLQKALQDAREDVV